MQLDALATMSNADNLRTAAATLVVRIRSGYYMLKAIVESFGA
jgi:hypothetical protein